MFLIRSRFRGIISSKQSHKEQSTQNQSKPTSSFSNSPKLVYKNMLDHHHGVSASPTSILDTKQFCYNSRSKPSSMDIKHPYEQKGIGLALESEEDVDSSSKPNPKMVVFGAKLKKVQIPEPETTHVVEQSVAVVAPFPTDLKSPKDYGIKTKKPDSSSVKKKSHCFREGLSLSEMELCEEYTCVMTHGNDPKTIHIFDDVIVETCRGLKNEEDDDLMRKGNTGNSTLVDFLEICYTCKVKLGDDEDIYIYRGEKSFCSPQCRFQQMIREEDEEF